MAEKNKWGEFFQKKGFLSLFIIYLDRIYFSKRVKNFLVKNLKEGDSILEPGCGSGYVSIQFAKEGYNVTFLDNSDIALKLVKEQYPKANTIKADINKMPFRSSTFDLTWNYGVIEHFDNPEKVVKEMIRVTKEQGKLILVVPAYMSLMHFLYKILNAFNLWTIDKQIFFKKSELKSLLKKADLDKIEISRPILSLGLSLFASATKKQQESPK
ncbi:class I SAM-dependent methyltransferase [Candidatus Woesearchaeota archaeon]|nr:class I SAM-dependent methyltransferase [Candidatus Woesearchaeota archaeon]